MVLFVCPRVPLILTLDDLQYRRDPAHLRRAIAAAPERPSTDKPHVENQHDVTNAVSLLFPFLASCLASAATIWPLCRSPLSSRRQSLARQQQPSDIDRVDVIESLNSEGVCAQYRTI